MKTIRYGFSNVLTNWIIYLKYFNRGYKPITINTIDHIQIMDTIEKSIEEVSREFSRKINVEHSYFFTNVNIAFAEGVDEYFYSADLRCIIFNIRSAHRSFFKETVEHVWRNYVLDNYLKPTFYSDSSLSKDLNTLNEDSINPKISISSNAGHPRNYLISHIPQDAISNTGTLACNENSGMRYEVDDQYVNQLTFDLNKIRDLSVDLNKTASLDFSINSGNSLDCAGLFSNAEINDITLKRGAPFHYKDNEIKIKLNNNDNLIDFRTWDGHIKVITSAEDSKIDTVLLPYTEEPIEFLKIDIYVGTSKLIFKPKVYTMPASVIDWVNRRLSDKINATTGTIVEFSSQDKLLLPGFPKKQLNYILGVPNTPFHSFQFAPQFIADEDEITLNTTFINHLEREPQPPQSESELELEAPKRTYSTEFDLQMGLILGNFVLSFINTYASGLFPWNRRYPINSTQQEMLETYAEKLEQIIADVNDLNLAIKTSDDLDLAIETSDDFAYISNTLPIIENKLNDIKSHKIASSSDFSFIEHRLDLMQRSIQRLFNPHPTPRMF